MALEPEGGPRCRGRDTNPRRSLPSCARLMSCSRRGTPSPMRSTRSASQPAADHAPTVEPPGWPSVWSVRIASRRVSIMEPDRNLETGVVVDPREAAESAGLVYVSDEEPGIRRRRAGKGFTYKGPDGRAVRDAATLARIRSLAIPPAWTDVWICRDPNGHLQATGRDARGRKQHRYHPRFREAREQAKFDRVMAFARALPGIRKRCDEDLALPGLPRNKVLAAVVRLLELTLIRVGNEEYARLNKSFGLTTLRDRHAKIEGSTIRFRFRGKSGKEHE